MAAVQLDLFLVNVVGPDKIYLHREAVDLRKSISGLVLIIEQEIKVTPMSPALVVFCNKIATG